MFINDAKIEVASVVILIQIVVLLLIVSWELGVGNFHQ